MTIILLKLRLLGLYSRLDTTLVHCNHATYVRVGVVDKGLPSDHRWVV